MGVLHFFAELKRRRVVRVAAVYAVVSFVLVQVADLLVPALLLPDWVFRFIVLILILGFPVALVLAWAFEITPDGVVRAEAAAPKPDPDVPSLWRRRTRLAFYAGVGALVAVGAFLAFLRLEPGEPAPGSEAPVAAPAVAVLPFVNMSPDPHEDHFSDGITEDLITHLSRIEGLRVTSRTSVMRFKGSDLPIAEIAAELGVTHVLEGSVRRAGGEVRINAQLIDAALDAHLWAEIYDRELTDIFRIQSEITQEISRALEQHLSPGDRSRIAEGGTASLTAYDLLLRGRDHLLRPGQADVRKYEIAAEFFRRALELDPEYARAYSGLAEVFYRYVGLPAIPVRRDSILYYAGRAVALDPELAEAVTVLGFGYFFAQDWDRAERQFRRALSLDRNHADAMDGMARLTGVRGRLDEAARWQLRALAVDPLSPYRLHAAGILHFDLGDLDRAEEAFRRAVNLAPDHPEANVRLAWIHLIRGDEDRADQTMRRLGELADHDGVHMATGLYEAVRGRSEASEAHFARTPLSDFGATGAIRAALAKVRGEDARAEELMRGPDAMVTEWERQGYMIPPRHPLYRAIVQDDVDGALQTLRTHWRQGLRWVEDPPSVSVYWIDLDPALAPLRNDPRFQTLLREMRAGLDSMRVLVGESSQSDTAVAPDAFAG